MLSPELQILIHKDPSFTFSYKWLREEQAVPRVRRLKREVNRERKEVHGSRTTGAMWPQEGMMANFSSYSLACLCIPNGFRQLASILRYTNKLIYLEQAAK